MAPHPHSRRPGMLHAPCGTAVRCSRAIRSGRCSAARTWSARTWLAMAGPVDPWHGSRKFRGRGATPMCRCRCGLLRRQRWWLARQPVSQVNPASQVSPASPANPIWRTGLMQTACRTSPTPGTGPPCGGSAPGRWKASYSFTSALRGTTGGSAACSAGPHAGPTGRGGPSDEVDQPDEARQPNQPSQPVLLVRHQRQQSGQVRIIRGTACIFRTSSSPCRISGPSGAA